MGTGETPGDAATQAKERSGVYGFLAAVFREEVNAEALKQLKEPGFAEALSAAGVDGGGDFLARPEGELLEELAVEYARLFLGPGKHVSPYASVYLEGKGRTLWGKTTESVKTYLESSGFEFRENYHGLPDHISVEMEFMQYLASIEGRALDEDDQETFAECRKLEGEFLVGHMIKWVPLFCWEIAAAAELPFYRRMAELTRDFIQAESAELGLPMETG